MFSRLNTALFLYLTQVFKIVNCTFIVIISYIKDYIYDVSYFQTLHHQALLNLRINMKISYLINMKCFMKEL